MSQLHRKTDGRRECTVSKAVQTQFTQTGTPDKSDKDIQTLKLTCDHKNGSWVLEAVGHPHTITGIKSAFTSQQVDFHAEEMNVLKSSVVTQPMDGGRVRGLLDTFFQNGVASRQLQMDVERHIAASGKKVREI